MTGFPVLSAKTLIITPLILILVLVVACGSSSTSAPTTSAQPTVVANPTSAVVAATPVPTSPPAGPVAPTGTLNFAVSEMGPAVFVLHNQGFEPARVDGQSTHETMFVTSTDGNSQNRLVREWSLETTPDGAIYTINLQEGVQFHKGWGEFTADDFIFSLEDAAAPGSPHAATRNINKIFLCDECELTKIDSHTLTLKRPKPTFEFTFASRIPQPQSVSMHSKAHFESVGEDAANQESVGTGPWNLIDFETGQFRLMEAVPDHWRKTPEFAQFKWWEIKEESTRLANFLTGQLDIATFRSETIQQIKLENDPDIKFMSFAGEVNPTVILTGQQYNTDAPSHVAGADGSDPRIKIVDDAYDCTLAWVSCDRDITSDEWATARDVRIAMNLAIDREKLVNNLAFGEGQPFFHSFWGGHEFRLKEQGLDQLTYEFDPVRARELLASAGFSDGFDLDVILTPRAAPGAIENLQAIALMWEDIGIRSTQQNLQFSSFRPLLVNRSAKAANSQAYTPQIEPITLYAILFNSNSPINFGFEHPVFQAMMDEATTLVDDDERWAKMAEMARFLHNEAITFSAYQADLVFPLGPALDPWTPLGGPKPWLSNWEFAPPRK